MKVIPDDTKKGKFAKRVKSAGPQRPGKPHESGEGVIAA